MRHDPAVLRTRAAVRSSLRDVASGEGVGGAALVAVSGGADSLALAAATAHIAPKLALRPAAAVIDHGLQPDSAAVAERAAGQCRDLGLAPVVIRRVEVGGPGGPEAAARTARYAALHACADELGAEAILLGHTLDDQAETVLLGLARGSGARSLAGMAAVTGRLRRPFLDVRRADTVRACEALGLTPWTDPHNTDPRYARSRVRSHALPALEDAIGPGVAEALARTAAQLRADADALDELSAALADDGLEIQTLLALPAAVRSRLLRRAIVDAGAPDGRVAASHVTAVDALVTGWHGQGPVSLPSGLVAERRCGRLVLR